MEELIERVSVITKSPVISKLWQNSYRQAALVCLVFCVFFICAPANARQDRVNRHQLVSAIYERVYNKRITEVEAVESGLIEPYEDGSYKLDLSASRAMAAQAFYRLAIQQGTTAVVPRAFADIHEASPHYNALRVVGAAFMPDRNGRMRPNDMLLRRDIFHAVTVLLDKKVIRQQDLFDRPAERISVPVLERLENEAQQVAKNSSVADIKAYRPDLDPDQNYVKRSHARVARVDPLVSAQQMNPQLMVSINEASNAMDDVEQLLESMGANVLDMASTYPTAAEDENDLRRALSKIDGVLSVLVTRFEYSKLQLSTVTFVDPDQMHKSAVLDERIKNNLEQAELLRRRIALRLAEPVRKD